MTELADALARATLAAARAAARLRGCGDRNAVDRAAVDAMRAALDRVDIDGRVVIGEGEKDEAPMLAAGERVGTGRGPALDIAVDPIDGTRCVAEDRVGAIAAIGACPRGQMHAPPGFTRASSPSAARSRVAAGSRSTSRRSQSALPRLAAALGRRPAVAILDRPRNQALIEAARASAAELRLLPDADLSATVALALTGREPVIDLLVGVGGCPEAVVSACALSCLGGHLICQPWSPGAGATGPALELDGLVGGAPIAFAATGVTGSVLVAPGETLIIDADGPRRWAPA
ncbi:MAG: fructose-bisphosphatase class II [Myxococcales bacterium]|nr:fructose-bisphosphatase class II [Myxococcales bacterium]